MRSASRDVAVALLALTPLLWHVVAGENFATPLLAARCHARCLKLFDSEQADSQQSSCLIPCEHSIFTLDCDEICKKEELTYCSNSCYFFRNISAFVNCSSEDCSSNSTGCCITDTEEDLPPIPVNVTLTERRFGKAVHITWISEGHYDNEGDPVVYVVQMRWNFGKQLNLHNVTEWETLTKTTASTVILKEVLIPGRWYQVRVATVSTNGTKGYSNFSLPFTLSISPRPPGPPQNLRESTANKDDHPGVQWEPPVSDMPIIRYRVVWCKRLRSLDKNPVTSKEHERLLPSNRLAFTLKHLEIDSLYQVQVQAVSEYGGESLDGEKATIYISTFSSSSGEVASSTARRSQANQQVGTVHDLVVKLISNNETELKANASWRLVTDLQKRSLKFVVRWDIESCPGGQIELSDKKQHTSITRESTFVVQHLKPGCEYRISVQPTVYTGHFGEPTEYYFLVPTCDQLRETDFPHPSCSTNSSRIISEGNTSAHTSSAYHVQSDNILLLFSFLLLQLVLSST